jgi:acrylyl-CoA reductase (NADPH)
MLPRPSFACRPSSTSFVVEHRHDAIQAGVRTLRLHDLAPGEVTAAVSWSAVDHKDGLVARPEIRVARLSPLVPGVDLAGGARGRVLVRRGSA